ncbi:hypothetical protein LACDD01_00381 [Lactococcus sp. DD01]|nr:hypothetical protein LACDD01_00381 [Lactococcus sp. DD01]
MTYTQDKLNRENRIRAPAEQNISKLISKRIEDDERRKQRILEQAYRIKRKIKYYCQANDFDLFWTLTLNDEKVNAKNYEYSRKNLQAWLKYQREKYGKFDFLFLPELHKSGRIHFHGVTGGLYPPLIESRYPRSNRLIKKSGLQIYNAGNWKNGFSTVSKIQDRKKSANYITKYITKELIEIPSAFHQPRYFVSRGLKQPEISLRLLPDDYFKGFKPSFVAGNRSLASNEFEADVFIYQLDILEEGELVQDSPPETVWKLRQEKSPDGNQDFQK